MRRGASESIVLGLKSIKRSTKVVKNDGVFVWEQDVAGKKLSLFFRESFLK